MSVGAGHVNLTDEPVSEPRPEPDLDTPDPLLPVTPLDDALDNAARAYGRACAELKLTAYLISRYLFEAEVPSNAVRMLLAGLVASGADRAERELIRGIRPSDPPP